MTVVLDAHGTAIEQAERLTNALAQGDSEASLSSWGACLTPILSALNWRGEPRHIAESLPHFASSLDLEELRAVLARLGYVTRPLTISAASLDPRLLPCLFVTRRDLPLVLLGRDGIRLRAFDGTARQVREFDAREIRGTAYVIETREREPANKPRDNSNWFGEILRRFRPLFAQMLAISLLSNILGVAVPLGIMAIYDQVIGKQSIDALGAIAFGVVLALGAEFGLRRLRDRAQAHLAGRMEYLIGSKVFEHVLHLPAIFTERAQVGGQVARLREFESLRDFFTSPLAGVFLDMPFIFVFVAVIYLLAGPLALVPIVLIVVYVFLGLLLFPMIRRLGRQASLLRSERHAFLVELLSRFGTVKQLGAEQTWAERFREISGNAAAANLQTVVLQAVVQTLAQALMMAGGIATLAIGVVMVIDGTLTVGALIACMALVWRVLAPLQTGFTLFISLEQTAKSIAQLNQLLRYPPEREPDALSRGKKVFAGNIGFSRVLLRHSPQQEPALININLQVQQGEIFGVTGKSGSGKTTLLKVLLGLYVPQAGAVTIDGIDVRQVDPTELRQAVAYLPQTSHEFYGTIAQNLRLAQPTASHDEILRACEMAGLLPDIRALPQGFDTRIGDHDASRFPTGFRQRLGLARVYLRDAPIMLFDEPTNNLDEEHDNQFIKALEHYRGNRTIILVTHRPSHLRLADRMGVLVAGQMLSVGTPEELLPKWLGYL